jgi:nickel/cobalt exporter
MAIGTAITVSALASLAVGSREMAARIGNRRVGSERVRIAAGVGGSALVMLLGAVFFYGSLNGGTGL